MRRGWVLNADGQAFLLLEVVLENKDGDYLVMIVEVSRLVASGKSVREWVESLLEVYPGTTILSVNTREATPSEVKLMHSGDRN